MAAQFPEQAAFAAEAKAKIQKGATIATAARFQKRAVLAVEERQLPPDRDFEPVGEVEYKTVNTPSAHRECNCILQALWVPVRLAAVVYKLVAVVYKPAVVVPVYKPVAVAPVYKPVAVAPVYKPVAAVPVYKPVAVVVTVYKLVAVVALVYKPVAVAPVYKPAVVHKEEEAVPARQPGPGKSPVAYRPVAAAQPEPAQQPAFWEVMRNCLAMSQ